MKEGTVELRIERIVAGGLGLARTPEGTVLVRGALPGELVTARPIRRGGALRAHAIEIREPHPRRVDLRLPPGADLPLAYEAQLPIKEELVREALVRIARMQAPVEAITPSPRELGYRTAAQYATIPPHGLAARAAGSNRLVALRDDPLVAEPIAALFEVCAARPLNGVHEVVFRASQHEGRTLVGLLGAKRGPFERIARMLADAGAAGVVYGQADEAGRFRGRSKVLEKADTLVEDFGGVQATVSVASFAQVNPLAAGMLYREAAEIAGKGTRALDLYAGSGILGLHLAPAFGEVVAIEIDAGAVRRGEADARRAGAESLRFRRGDARTARREFPADVVALDPPRAGLEPEVIEILAEGAASRIVYVSCDPATWARDVARLAAHGYRLTVVRPFDFYPYTHHVEVLSLLER